MALTKIGKEGVTGISNSSNATAITIDSSENVGVGTASPAATLTVAHVSGTDGRGIRLVNSSNNQTYETRIGTEGIENTSYSIRDMTADVVRFSISSAGKVFIGTTSGFGQSMLSVKPQDTNRIVATRSFNTDPQHHFLFENNSGTGVGTITCSTSATTFSTSSDYRLKTAVAYDWDATSRLKQLKPARFKWIADGDDAVPVDGFLAHEVQDIVPEAISGTKDAMMDEEYEVTPAVLDEDGNVFTEAVMGTRSVPNYQGIDQSKLVPLLVKTILELEARIAALETA